MSLTEYYKQKRIAEYDYPHSRTKSNALKHFIAKKHHKKLPKVERKVEPKRKMKMSVEEYDKRYNISGFYDK